MKPIKRIVLATVATTAIALGGGVGVAAADGTPSTTPSTTTAPGTTMSENPGGTSTGAPFAPGETSTNGGPSTRPAAPPPAPSGRATTAPGEECCCCCMWHHHHMYKHPREEGPGAGGGPEGTESP